jgi:flavin-dependent dehydrogenase
MGLDIERYPNKRYAERGYDRVERVALGRRLLVGEAAGIDPITGEGIAQAIEYGVLAGRFLAGALQRAPTRPDVSGWSRRLRRSRLAWDLRARALGVRLFYGPARDTLERFLLAHPDSLHLGCQHFAAQPYDPSRLARLGLAIAAFLARRQTRRIASRDAWRRTVR